MRCPKDDTDLIEIERQGIDIDYCPTCKGVWLDRSELDELISRSASAPAVSASSSSRYEDEPRRESREQRGRSGGLMDRVGGLLDDDDRDDRSRRHCDRDDDWDDDRHDGDRYDDRDSRGKKKKGRKRGMLEDLFDF